MTIPTQIGERYIIDPTILEELSSEVTLTVGINKDGATCGMQKGAGGSINPSLLTEMVQVCYSCKRRSTKRTQRYLQTASTIGKSLISQLDKKLIADDEAVQTKKMHGEPVQKLGFFAAVI